MAEHNKELAAAKTDEEKAKIVSLFSKLLVFLCSHFIIVYVGE